MEQSPFILVLINGILKKNRKTKNFIAQLKTASNSSFDIEVSKYSGHIIELSEQLGGKYKYLVSFGGDGTHHEVIEGLMKLQPENRPKVLLYPGGSGNDFNRQFATPRLDILANNPSELHSFPIDIGQIKTDDFLHHFLNICSIGFTGKVVEKLNVFRQNTGIRKSYLIAIFQALFSYKNTHLKIFPIAPIEKEYFLLTICNGRVFGNGLIISPKGKVNDQKFEVVSIGKITALDLIKSLFKLKKGITIHHKEVQYFDDIDNLEIQSTDLICGEMDGEQFASKTIKFQIIPNAIVLVF